MPRGFKTRTGGYIYDRRMVEGLRASGWRVTVHELHPDFPLPSATALHEAAQIMEHIPAGRPVLIDGLALGGMPAIAERERSRLRLIALIHHPLALETGLDSDKVGQLRDAERRALAAVQSVITTSRTTAQALADYGVASERITVVIPGTEPAPLAEGSGGDVLNLLCVATLTPRKGHAILFEALAGLRDKAWRLTCVGSSERDPKTAAALRRQIASFGLDDRIRLLGELDDEALGRRYAQADVFVLASHYEGYGMVFSEALARGLPIVAASGGAVPETVPAAAALLVKPGDSAALRAALGRLMEGSELRAQLREGARRARHTLPTWQEASARFAAAIMDAAPT